MANGSFISSIRNPPPHRGRLNSCGSRLVVELHSKIFSIKNLNGWGCARFPSDLCVIAERSDDRKQAIITSFDPLEGRGSDLMRITLDPKLNDWSFGTFSRWCPPGCDPKPGEHRTNFVITRRA